MNSQRIGIDQPRCAASLSAISRILSVGGILTLCLHHRSRRSSRIFLAVGHRPGRRRSSNRVDGDDGVCRKHPQAGCRARSERFRRRRQLLGLRGRRRRGGACGAIWGGFFKLIDANLIPAGSIVAWQIPMACQLGHTPAIINLEVNRRIRQKQEVVFVHALSDHGGWHDQGCWCRRNQKRVRQRRTLISRGLRGHFGTEATCRFHRRIVEIDGRAARWLLSRNRKELRIVSSRGRAAQQMGPSTDLSGRHRTTFEAALPSSPLDCPELDLVAPTWVEVPCALI